MQTDQEYKRAIILQAVRNAGKLSSRGVQDATSLPRSTARRYLLEMYRSGKLHRSEEDNPNRRGWRHMYWTDRDTSLMEPRGEDGETLALRAIVRGAEDSKEIAEAAGLSVSAAQRFLVDLYRRGVISRRRAGREYVYWMSDAEPVIVDNPYTAEEMDRLWWADIDEAIRRARPNWRIGELFPKEIKNEGFERRRAKRAAAGRIDTGGI